MKTRCYSEVQIQEIFEVLTRNVSAPIRNLRNLVRTLLDRKDNIDSEDIDKDTEENTIRDALSLCGYPKLGIDNVKDTNSTPQKRGKITKRTADKNKG